VVTIRNRSFGRTLVLLCTMLASLILAVPAAQAGNSGGSNNRGDVWTDNVGQQSGPGHEQDVHLQCADINLWGAGMAEASGTYTIDSWQPSGSGEQVYSSTWSYDLSKGGSQPMSVIDVHKLVAAAAANGDKPVNAQGYHFKLELSQNPQKHKTFWVNCSAPTTPPPTCDHGYQWDKDKHMCVPCPPKPCPTGQHRDDHGNCVPDTPPPCPSGQHHDDHGKCVPDTPPTCGPGMTGTPPNCTPTPPTCPSGTTPTMENGQLVCVKVVVVPGPTQVVVTPCPSCNCPPTSQPGPQPTPTPVAQKPKPKCPKVKKSQIHISFTPKHLKHGNLNLNVKVPASWHLKKIVLAICTPKSGIGNAKSCKSGKSTFVKKLVIKLNKHGRGHLVLPLWKTNLWGHWLYGHHRMQFTLKLPCGIMVVVRMPYFNLDPQPGVVPPLLR
jgi:hypothetical protein